MCLMLPCNEICARFCRKPFYSMWKYITEIMVIWHLIHVMSYKYYSGNTCSNDGYHLVVGSTWDVQLIGKIFFCSKPSLYRRRRETNFYVLHEDVILLLASSLRADIKARVEFEEKNAISDSEAVAECHMAENQRWTGDNHGFVSTMSFEGDKLIVG